MEKQRRPPSGIPTALPIDLMPIAAIEHTALVWFNGGNSPDICAFLGSAAELLCGRCGKLGTRRRLTRYPLKHEVANLQSFAGLGRAVFSPATTAPAAQELLRRLR